VVDQELRVRPAPAIARRNNRSGAEDLLRRRGQAAGPVAASRSRGRDTGPRSSPQRQKSPCRALIAARGRLPTASLETAETPLCVTRVVDITRGMAVA
jgi:hypothetical protein